MSQFCRTCLKPLPKNRAGNEQYHKECLKDLYPKYKCPKCGDWFHMPWKFCKCDSKKEIK